jgi:hypothetical protein
MEKEEYHERQRRWRIVGFQEAVQIPQTRGAPRQITSRHLHQCERVLESKQRKRRPYRHSGDAIGVDSRSRSLLRLMFSDGKLSGIGTVGGTRQQYPRL